MAKGQTKEKTKPKSTEAHVVQTVREEGRKLVLDQPKYFPTPEQAVAAAQRLSERKAGVAAFSLYGELDEGIIDETIVRFRAGRLPPGMADD